MSDKLEKRIVVMMSKEKDTKNKVFFREDGGTADLETLYVPKATLMKLGGASRIKITIEPA